MNYSTFCKKNSLTASPQTKRMWRMALETIEASIDIKKEPMDTITMNEVFKCKFNFAPLVTQDCNGTPVPCTQPAAKACPTKGNNPMYVDNDKHIESSKINYLSARVDQISYQKINDFRKLFGLVDDKSPDTATALVDRIQAGKFILSDETKNKPTYDPDRYIRWRDPAVKEDKAGFAAAEEAFEKAKQDTRDTIVIGTPAEGLVAVKALDAWAPTVGTA